MVNEVNASNQDSRASKSQRKGDNMAEDLVDGLTTLPKRMSNKFYEIMDKVPGPKKKVDTSWHDEMLRKANDSFKEDAAKKKVASVAPVKKIQAAPKKSTPKKVASTKR